MGSLSFQNPRPEGDREESQQKRHRFQTAFYLDQQLQEDLLARCPHWLPAAADQAFPKLSVQILNANKDIDSSRFALSSKG